MAVETAKSKLVIVTSPTAIVDAASWTTNIIDTLGFEFCEIFVMLGATDIGLTVCKIKESDTSGGAYTDVTGLVYGTSNNDTGVASALPSATDDNSIFGFEIDLRPRKRFIDATLTGGDGVLGSYVAAWAVLSRAHAVPMSGSDRGLAQLLRA